MREDRPSFLQTLERILGGQSFRWIALGIVALLAILVLSLPPISLWSRLFFKEPSVTSATLVSPTATATMPAEESPSPTPSPSSIPSPEATSTPTEVVATETPQTTSTPTASPTLTPTPKPDAVVNAGTGLNLRAGPSTIYEIVTVLDNGVPLNVLGKDPTGVWYQVEAGDGTKGWVHGDYVILNIPVSSIPVSSEIPSTPTPASTPVTSPTAAITGTPGASPTKTPAPPPPAPTGFGYGIQLDLAYGDPGPILDWVVGMGFNWVKWQVPWKWYEPQKGNIQWARMDEVVAAANAKGVHLLFSVVKAPDWARGGRTEPEGPPVNYNDYGDFVGALAAHFKGRVRAYEIWNEQNMKREWNTGRSLSAQEYVALLKVAYARVKAADPGAIVVSGAPTPTGVSDYIEAVDDALYLEQMYQAGLRNYCDAVGVHPSGYNMPPDADWRTYSNPDDSFRGPSDNHHRSWSYRGTMERYREIMVAYGDGGKKLWPTEFGWASIQNVTPSPAPGYEYGVDNTEAEQAQFLVRAFSLAKGWGYVGTMFVWNLNFGVTHGPNDEMAAFGILRPDGSARPAYTALRDMPK